MTVLSKCDMEKSIMQELIDGEGIGVRKPNDTDLALQPASMDVHLGRKVKHPKMRDNEMVIVDDRDTYPEYVSVDTPRPLVREDSFVLATTEENITVPKGMVALLHGRSSVGRLGMFVHNAGLIDPGFSGQVTLELTNAVDYDIELKAGMRIGQLTFHKMENAPDVGYSEYNSSKYNKQTGPTISRLWEDFE